MSNTVAPREYTNEVTKIVAQSICQSAQMIDEVKPMYYESPTVADLAWALEQLFNDPHVEFQPTESAMLNMLISFALRDVDWHNVASHVINEIDNPS